MKKEDFLCSKVDCTFAITGTCLESIDDPTRNCPHLKDAKPSLPTLEDGSSEESEAPVDSSARQFSTGLELGLQEVARLMQSRYAKLVGVLGLVEAGKTCLFTSIYLQLTGRHLSPHYRFIASDTLIGFEQRARHLRDWSKGGIPEQIVDHTHLGHSRSPAFLHLALRDVRGMRHDLLMPDLPGEWTSRLLSDASTANRFAFLSRSDIVLIVLEAPKFASPGTRNNAITDATHIIARLADDICLPTSIPMILAVTKCDETAGAIPAELNRVSDAASNRGYSVSTIPLAAFPMRAAQIPTGYGIDTLLAHFTSPCAGPKNPPAPTLDAAGRSYLKARGQR